MYEFDKSEIKFSVVGAQDALLASTTVDHIEEAVLMPIRLDLQGGGSMLFQLSEKNGLCEGHSLLTFSLQKYEKSKYGTAPKNFKWIKLEGFNLPDQAKAALANGYNCWSNSPMLSASDVLHGETDPVQEYFGDSLFYSYKEKPGQFHAWSYTIIDCGQNLGNLFIGGICEDRFYNVIELDLVNKRFNLLIDIDGFDFSNITENYLIAKFVIPRTINIDTPLMEIAKEWYREILENEFVPRKNLNRWSGDLPVTGYTSWYNKFTEISEKWLLQHIKSVKQHTSWHVFQVDDGYQSAVGDWLIPSESFPRKVDFILEKAKSESLMPGIWLAPFVAMEFSVLVKENPDFVLKDHNGDPVVCGDFPHWGGKFYALDTENQKFRNYIEGVVKYFADIGVKFIKADFLYASSMIPRNGKSKAELSSTAHEWFYSLCHSQNIYFLSCGAQMSSAYGRCDFSRIGADVAVEWEAVELEKHKSRERPSAISSMNNTIGRAILNGLTFFNDPDVVILRSENTEFSDNEKVVLTKLNKCFGGLLFCSDSPDQYKEKEYELLELFEDPSQPREVHSIHKVDSKDLRYNILTDKKIIDVTVSPRESVAFSDK